MQKHGLLGNFFLYWDLFYLFIFVYILWSLLFTQILFSYYPGPNTIQGSRRLVHSPNEPCGKFRDENGRRFVVLKGTMLCQIFSVPLLECDTSSPVLFLGQVMVAFSLSPTVIKENWALLSPQMVSKQDPVLKCVIFRKDRGAFLFQDEILPRVRHSFALG